MYLLMMSCLQRACLVNMTLASHLGWVPKRLTMSLEGRSHTLYLGDQWKGSIRGSVGASQGCDPPIIEQRLAHICQHCLGLYARPYRLVSVHARDSGPHHGQLRWIQRVHRVTAAKICPVAGGGIPLHVSCLHLLHLDNFIPTWLYCMSFHNKLNEPLG